jgi:tRNA threonylcarbamoyladenosine biosynthesis protein TsaB
MWLALDTATDLATVALAAPDGRVLEAEQPGARSHARAVLPLATELLRRADADLSALRGVVVADGPGSFTGLRVGASVAKALVTTRRVELRTAPSLLARAAAAADGDGGATILAVSDALRGELYAAAYRLPPGRVEVVAAPAVWRPDDLFARVSRPDRIVGDVPAALLDRLQTWAGTPVVRSPAGAPRAARLLELLAREGGTERVADVGAWEPVYGRPAEAQAQWEERHGRPLAHPVGRPD